MDDAIYKILTAITSDVEGVYLDFLSDKEVEADKNYVIYSLVSRSPYYETNYAKSKYQVAVYSKELETALNVRNTVSKYFSNLCGVVEDVAIMGSNVESETHHYDYKDGFYQAICEINLLYKLN